LDTSPQGSPEGIRGNLGLSDSAPFGLVKIAFAPRSGASNSLSISSAQFWQRRPEGQDFCVSRDEPTGVYYEQGLLNVESLRLLNSVEWQV